MTTFLIFLLTVAFIGLDALVMTGLWYAFDDQLAAALGYQPLGNLPFLLVLTALFFVILLLRQGAQKIG